MPSTKKGMPVQGSERAALKGARKVGAADPKERILVTVMVRRRPSLKGLSSVVEEISALRPQERKHLTHEEFVATHGADPAELEKVEVFAHKHGIDVVEVSPGQRRLVLSGTVAAFSKAFGVSLARYRHPKGTYRGRTGPVRVPEDLAPIIEGVFGLDNRPQAKPHMRVYGRKKGAVRPRTAGVSYTPPQIAELYDFPPGINGQGQCIAIIELGGGYSSSDLTTYFQNLGIPTPVVLAMSVDGGHNQPTGDPNGPDGEVMLDIEVAGAVAPGAKIVVYFAPNTDAGFLDAVNTAIHDTLNKPSAVSISWGGAESGWTNQAMQAMDQAFQDAAAFGVTICCASGDNGSTDGVDDGLLHVDFPASSPYAVACGGTRLEGSGSTITNEIVWNEGVSGGALEGESVMSLIYRTGKRMLISHHRQTRVAVSDGACPTWLVMLTLSLATRSWWMGTNLSSVEQARWPLSGLASSPWSTRNWAIPWVILIPGFTACPLLRVHFMTSSREIMISRVITALIRPVRAGMPARDGEALTG